MVDTLFRDAIASARRRAMEKVSPQFKQPFDLAKAIMPNTVQTPALMRIDDFLCRARTTPGFRGIISMPPQEGKSTRVTMVGPLYFLKHDPDMRIAIASYGQDLANEFGRYIRNAIADNSGQDGSLDLGLSIAPDNGSVSSWKLDGHEGGVRSVGIASGLTGRPADALFIDDPISNMEQAESLAYRQRAWNFWLTVGATRLAPGAPVILVLTRWHHDDLAGRLLSAEDGDVWEVLNIPAQADHDPNKGESDPLGREPGEYLESARGRTVEQWEAIKLRSGPRVWNALYQGRPTPSRGGIFCAEWPEYEQPLWTVRGDGSMYVPGVRLPEQEMCQSWDFTFKDTKSSDYVVGQVWLRKGSECYLLHQVRDRMTFGECLSAMREVTALWPQAIAKFVEDKANGPAIINSLSRQIPGIIPIEPEGSKFARAQAISPFTHAGNIILPAPLSADGDSLAPWITVFKQEMREFPNAANDDQVDAMSQAINRLLLLPLLEEDNRPQQAEEFEELDIRGWSISPV